MSEPLLSYILFLHQTTTLSINHSAMKSCLISCFYIKPQPCTLSACDALGCLISCFYIKPQLDVWSCQVAVSCLISCFYIKPQLNIITTKNKTCCLISCFYIKPQQAIVKGRLLQVVLYLVSTSNHNIYCLYPYTSYNYKNITLYKMVV